MDISEKILIDNGFIKKTGMNGQRCITPYYEKEIMERPPIKTDKYEDEYGVLRAYIKGYVVFLRKEVGTESWIITLKIINKQTFTPKDKLKYDRNEHENRERIAQVRWISDIDEINYIFNIYKQFSKFEIKYEKEDGEDNN